MICTIENIAEHIQANYDFNDMKVFAEDKSVILHLQSEAWSFVLALQLCEHRDVTSGHMWPALLAQGSFLSPETNELVTLAHMDSATRFSLLQYTNKRLTWCKLVAQLPNTNLWPRLLRREILYSKNTYVTQVDMQLMMVFDECEKIANTIYKVDDLTETEATQYVKLLTLETPHLQA